MYKFAVLSVLALLSFVAAYVPVTPKIVRVSSTSLNGYVPDGLSEDQWEAIKAEKAQAVAQRKQKFGSKGFEDLSEWLKSRDAKYPGQPGAGHTFAKVADKKPKNPDAAKEV